MKRLTIFRHAKSGWDVPVARDFDRPLNDKGKRGARAMGRHMHEEGYEFDRVVASPAVRVTETIDSMVAGYGRRLKPIWDRRVYLASAATLLELVQETPESIGDLMVVGHNPGLEDLVLMLVPDDGASGQRDALEEKFPTGAVARLEIGTTWDALAARGARLLAFARPRDVDPALGPDALA